MWVVWRCGFNIEGLGEGGCGGENLILVIVFVDKVFYLICCFWGEVVIWILVGVVFVYFLIVFVLFEKFFCY